MVEELAPWVDAALALVDATAVSPSAIAPVLAPTLAPALTPASRATALTPAISRTKSRRLTWDTAATGCTTPVTPTGAGAGKMLRRATLMIHRQCRPILATNSPSVAMEAVT